MWQDKKLKKIKIVRIDISKLDFGEIQNSEILICDCGNKDNHIGDDRFIDTVMVHYDGEYEIDDTGYSGFDDSVINKDWEAWCRTGDGDDFKEVEKYWHFHDFTLKPCDESEGEYYND